jgi:hypothetical protein
MKTSYNFYSFAFNPSVLGADKLWDNSSTIVGLNINTQT